MLRKSDIIKVIVDATVDRANYDIDTGELNWDYVMEDVKYYFRDEISESGENGVLIASTMFDYRLKYERVHVTD